MRNVSIILLFLSCLLLSCANHSGASHVKTMNETMLQPDDLPGSTVASDEQIHYADNAINERDAKNGLTWRYVRIFELNPGEVQELLERYDNPSGARAAFAAKQGMLNSATDFTFSNIGTFGDNSTAFVNPVGQHAIFVLKENYLLYLQLGNTTNTDGTMTVYAQKAIARLP